jgi:hypothetical protein
LVKECVGQMKDHMLVVVASCRLNSSEKMDQSLFHLQKYQQETRNKSKNKYSMLDVRSS